jgi:formate dehydrogenase major subunit
VRLREHLKAFPPEAMAELCGISAETLRIVARTFARAERGIVFWGMGISQHVHGTDNSRCLISLVMMCGHVGRPGTGLHPLRGQNNVQGASDAGLIPMVFPDYNSVQDTRYRAHLEELWGTRLSDRPGLTVVEIIDAIHRGEIKGMYIMGENPAMSDPDAHHAREALARLEHLVVQDIFLTETAIYADVVLPASAWPEKDGTVTNTNRTVQRGRKALPLPGDAREDLWIEQELARRLSLDWHYESPAEVFAEMKQAMPSLDNITWERLDREGAVTYPCDAEDEPGHDIVFSDGIFPTEDGRARLVPASIVPPAEQPDTEFPYVLTTGRTLEHWHTGAMTRRASNLDALEPEPFVSVNSADLRKLGLKAGDPVRVATRRGEIELMARQDNAVPQGLLFIPFCFVEAAANVLTNPQLDPFGKIPEFKYCAARLAPAPLAAAAE